MAEDRCPARICTQWQHSGKQRNAPRAIAPIVDYKNSLIALRWWYDGDSVSVADHSWLEVTRSWLPHEDKPGVGTWFSVAPGAGIWLNVGRSVRLQRKTYRGSALYADWLRMQGIRSGAAGERQAWTDLFLAYPEFVKFWWHSEAFTVMAYELGYDTVQINASESHPYTVPEIVLVSRASMLRGCTVPAHDEPISGFSARAAIKHCARYRHEGNNTSARVGCPFDSELRTHRATRPCLCDNTSHLTCREEPSVHLPADVPALSTR